MVTLGNILTWMLVRFFIWGVFANVASESPLGDAKLNRR
jgi:hypothetical protein